MSRWLSALTLGWRLALRTTGHARVRTVSLVGAATLGTALTLATLMIGRAVRRAPSGLIVHDSAGTWWLAGAALATLLPVMVLVGTVARLSAALREQRSSRLRLLGLTPTQTRLVNLGENGILATGGWLLGLVLAWLGRPLLATSGIGGRQYELAGLGPGPAEVLISLAVVPLLVVVAATSSSIGGRAVLTTSRGGRRSSPGWWRLLPLVVGLAMLIMGRRSPRPTDLNPGMRDTWVLGWIALLALGTLLALPVAVRYLASWLVRRGRPVSIVAGRRLQAQPAAQTRVLSGLLIALFLATAAQGVVATYESVPQYATPRYQTTVEASVQLQVPPGATAEDVVARAMQVPGVRDTVISHRLLASCGESTPVCEGAYLQVHAASCDVVQQAVPGTTGCRDDRAAWVNQPYDFPGFPDTTTLTLYADNADGSVTGPPLLEVPLDRVSVIQLPDSTADRVGVPVFVPSGLAGVREAVEAHGSTQVLVTSDPRRDLVEAMSAAGLQVNGFWDMGEMDRIQRTIDTVRLVAVLALVLGLISCAVGALDRALERRQEVIRLQLLGVPARTLTLSHWIEVAVPVLLGCGLALGLGWLAADSYLLLVSDSQRLRVESTFIWPMIAGASLGSVLVSWVTSLAAHPRIRPDLIRTT